MATTSAQYTITTTPQKILSADLQAEMVYLHAISGDLYIGGDSTVSTTTGYKMDNGNQFSLTSHEGELWAVTNSGSMTLAVLVATK